VKACSDEMNQKQFNVSHLL